MTAELAAAPLYSRDILALAVSLADFPIRPDMPSRGEARSRTCGSRVEFAGSLDHDGRVAHFGLRVSACAVGQAAAAVFAGAARGSTRAGIERARAGIANWLQGEPPPEWPGIEVLAPALAYPARHGAILLAWDAALAALPKS